MRIFTLRQIVNIARNNSPIYRQLYDGVDLSNIKLESLPVLWNDKLMEVVRYDNAISFFNSDTILDGILYQSSGTTGKPKATMFGKEELQTNFKLLSSIHWKLGSIQDGDIIANLCIAGSGSFMHVHGTIENFPGRCSEIPLGCYHEFLYILETVKRFKANALAGINTTILALSDFLLKNRAPMNNINRILCGGELLYGAQLSCIKEAFPNAKIIPFMFATTEVGIIGYHDLKGAQNEFCLFDNICQLEIIDPISNVVINEIGKLGRAVVTSFIRTSAPAIRVDIGDQAEWIDPYETKNRRFSIHGRIYKKEFKFHNTLLMEHDIYNIIKRLETKISLMKLHAEIFEENIIFKISFYKENTIIAQKELILNEVFRELPELENIKNKIQIEFVNFEYFSACNRRKSNFIEDKRISH